MSTKIPKLFDFASVFKVIGYFLSIVTVITIISAVSVSNYKARLDRQQMMRSDSTLIHEVRNLNTKVSSIEVDINNIQTIQKEQTEAQNSLRASYIQHLRDDKALTTDEFLKYMEGIQFELKKNYNMSMFETQSIQVR